MTNNNPTNPFSFDLTKAPERKKLNQGEATLPALDPAKSPLAQARLTTLTELQNLRREPVAALARMEQAVANTVQAVLNHQGIVVKAIGPTFGGPLGADLVADFIAHVTGLEDQFAIAEALLLLHRERPDVKSITDLPKGKNLRSFIDQEILENNPFDGVKEIEALFQDIVRAESAQKQARNEATRTHKISNHQMEKLSEYIPDSDALPYFKQLSTLVQQAVEHITHSAKSSRRPDARDEWADLLIEPGLLKQIRTTAMKAINSARGDIDSRSARLSDVKYSGLERLDQALSDRTLRSSHTLSPEEMCVVRFAAIIEPSQKDLAPGTPGNGVSARIEANFEALHKKLGDNELISIIQRLEKSSEGSPAWLTPEQACSLRAWITPLPVQAVTSNETAQHSYKVEEMSLTSLDILDRALGADRRDIIVGRLPSLPDRQEVGKRLELLQQTVRPFDFTGIHAGVADEVAALVTHNPHLLTMNPFEPYVTGLQTALTKAKSLQATEPQFTITGAPAEFATPQKLAQLTARVDREVGYRAAVQALTAQGIHAQAAMVVLRGGFFWGGNLHFDSPIKEQTLLQNAKRFASTEGIDIPQKTIEKAMSELQSAGAIRRGSRGKDVLVLTRDVIDQSAHSTAVHKALEWVQKYPDKRA